MPDTIITVQGHHATEHLAERAGVSVSVQFDGPERSAVFAAATEAAAAVRATLAALDTGLIDSQSTTVRAWSQRPWNNEGAQLDPVHYASVDVSARFDDAAVLSSWLEQVVAIDGTNVSGVAWELTEQSLASAVAEVRTRAVANALSKATAYATALGLTGVTPVAIADPGMLGDSGSGGAQPPTFERAMMKASFDSSGSAPLALEPERIQISATVDARFVATS